MEELQEAALAKLVLQNREEQLQEAALAKLVF